MVQRDLIKDQIEEMGKVLGKVLVEFLGFKSTGKISQGIEISNQQLQSQLDIDIQKLISMNKEELKQLLEQKKVHHLHYEALSQYLYEVGEYQLSKDNNTAKLYLTKALELLDLLDDSSGILSFERLDRKAQIESLLK